MGVEILHSVELVDEMDGHRLTVTRGEVEDGQQQWRLKSVPNGTGSATLVVIVSSADLAAFGAALRDLVAEQIWTHGATDGDPLLRTEP
jgi:hypothetical protein